MAPQPMPDLNPLLAMMLLGKQGKSNLSGISSMTGMMDNPWIGILTGAYDPLSQQNQADIPDSPTYNYIANDPNSPLTVKRVAQAIVEEGLPIHVVQNEINSMSSDGGYSKEELKSLANKLAVEKADVDKAKGTAAKSNMFSKGGFSNYTEQYSDNPSLAPFSDEARKYMSSLANQASSMRSEANLSTRNMAGQNKKLAKKNLSVPEIQKLLDDVQNEKYNLEDQTAWWSPQAAINDIAPLSVLKGVFRNPFKKHENKDRKLKGELNAQEEALKKKLSQAKVAEKKFGKGQKAPINEVYGDLSDPKNLAKYFEIQSKIQTANQLEKKASDYGGSVISKAEQEGRTPFMDQYAQRALALRMLTGQ